MMERRFTANSLPMIHGITMKYAISISFSCVLENTDIRFLHLELLNDVTFRNTHLNVFLDFFSFKV